MYKTKQSGFTIIELVVVIVIIGILAAVALPRFLGLQDKAHDAVVEGTQTALASGVTMAHALWQTYGRDSALDDIMKKDLGATTLAAFCTYTSGTPTTDNGLDTNSKGYPEGCLEDEGGAARPIGSATNDPNTVDADRDCGEIFAYLMSQQSVTAEYAGMSGAGPKGTATASADFTAFRNNNPQNVEFFATVETASTDPVIPNEWCKYSYAPDLNPDGATRFVWYDPQTGRVGVENLTTATFSAGT